MSVEVDLAVVVGALVDHSLRVVAVVLHLVIVDVVVALGVMGVVAMIAHVHHTTMVRLGRGVMVMVPTSMVTVTDILQDRMVDMDMDMDT